MDIVPLNGAEWATQSAAYTGTAGTVTGWTRPTADSPCGVSVVVTSDAYVRVGNAVTATTGDQLVPAGTLVTFRIPDHSPKFVVSAIQLSTGGTLYAKPIGGA